MSIEELVEAIRSCRRCVFTGKPFLAHEVYERWLPKRVKLLLIAESPPPGRKRTFFYNLDVPDRLRRNMRAILGLEVPDHGVLSWMKDSGIFLTAAIKCRPIRPEDKARDERLLRHMAFCCSDILALEVKVLKPEKIMLMGRIAELAAKMAGLRPCEVFPHPNYVVRFRRDLIPVIREAILRAISCP